MSTIKSSDEHLTLNADGTSKDIKFQANGVEKASISSAGAFTSTTIDATKLTGDLPAISGANLTGVGVAGITSTADATAITINATEDVGIGVTPKTTSSSFDSLQIGGGGSISAYYNTVNGAGTDFGNNFYVNSSGTESYIFTEEAAKSKFEHGAIHFYTANSGSADAAITWTDAMTIDNNGYVTKPNQPIATASWTSSIAVNNVIPASAIKVNVGSHLASSGRFTAPIAGIYWYSFTGMSNQANDFYVQLRKNGTTLGTDTSAYTNAETYSRGTSFGYISLAANDYLEFFIPSGHSTAHGNYGTINFALAA